MVETKLVDSSDETVVCVVCPAEHKKVWDGYLGMKMYKDNVVLIPHLTAMTARLYGVSIS